MTRNVYCIYDRVAEEANFPFQQKNDACAVRAFTEVINRDVRKVKQLKLQDYELWFIGVWDSELFQFVGLDGRKLIMKGDQVEEIDYPEEPAAAPIPQEMLAQMFKNAMPTLPAPVKKGLFGRRK